jgi:hypothetical protein
MISKIKLIRSYKNIYFFNVMISSKSNDLNSDQGGKLISYHFPGLSGSLEQDLNAQGKERPLFQEEQTLHCGFGSSTASDET